VPGVGVQQLLQLADALAKFQGFLAGLVFVESVAKGGIELLEPDGRDDFRGLFHEWDSNTALRVRANKIACSIEFGNWI
jgi:hypothetical protein